MDQSVHDIPHISADAVSKLIVNNPFSGNITERYGIFKSFHNSLPVRVRVIDRSGVSTIIPPNITKGKKGEFYINESRIIPRDIKFDSNYILNSTATLHEERKLLAEEKEKEFDAFKAFKDANIIYSFTMRRIMAHGGVIYHPETDTIIAIIDDNGKGPDENTVFLHPQSHEGLTEFSKLMVSKSIASRKYNDFIFTIRIVDNIGSYGKRFTLINGYVYSIAPTRDTTCREGIYVICSFPVDGDYESTGTDEQYFSLDQEADNHLGLYRSFHEALITKDRLATIELQLKEAKLQQTAQEQKFAAEKARMQAEINELESIRNKRKEMNALNSEMYKSQSDFLKHLPTIITALGTIIVVSLKVAESTGGGGGGKK